MYNNTKRGEKMGILYGLKDFFCASENEKQLKKYKQAKELVDRNITEIRNYIYEADNQLRNFESTYSFDSNNNYGYVIDTYVENSDRFYQKIKEIINYFSTILSNLEEDQKYAQDMIDKYYEACKKEDEEGRKR